MQPRSGRKKTSEFCLRSDTHLYSLKPYHIVVSYFLTFTPNSNCIQGAWTPFRGKDRVSCGGALLCRLWQKWLHYCIDGAAKLQKGLSVVARQAPSNTLRTSLDFSTEHFAVVSGMETELSWSFLHCGYESNAYNDCLRFKEIFQEALVAGEILANRKKTLSSKHLLMAHGFLGFQKTCIFASLLAEEEVWEEVGHILIKLILRGQQHRLVVDEQQQQVEEEQQHNASQHHQDGRNAVLLGNDACLGIQWLQQVRQTCANTIALWQWVALSIGCGLLGVANREVASFRRHAHLTSLAARIHEAHLAGQQAQAAQQQC